MRCPLCGHDDARVKDSRPREGKSWQDAGWDVIRNGVFPAAPVHAPPSVRSPLPREQGAANTPTKAQGQISVLFDNAPPGTRISAQASGTAFQLDTGRGSAAARETVVVSGEVHAPSGSPAPGVSPAPNASPAPNTSPAPASTAPSASAGNSALTPKLQQEIAVWRQHDYGAEQVNLAVAKQDLADDAPGVAKAEAKVKKATTDLQQAQQQGADPETISKLQERLAGAQDDSSLKDLKEHKEKVAALQASVDQLAQINKDLTTFAVGKTVTLTTGGKPHQYTIQGPGHKFGSEKEAAVDGIALSFYVTSQTGDGFERGAWIEKTGDSYTYHDPQVGTVPTRKIHKAGINVLAGVPYIPLQSWLGGTPVAYFHIHPDNSILVKSDNYDFSGNDKDSYKGMIHEDPTPDVPEHTKIHAYLGGSDGSLRLLTSADWNKSQKLEPGGYFDVPKVN